jgi:hypothetical protein
VRRLALRAALALVLLVGAALALWSVNGWAWRIEHDRAVPVTVTAWPLDGFRRGVPGERRFGPLEFIGGFEARGSHGAFGGISGFRVREGGLAFLAVTDVGDWLKGRLVYAGARLAGLEGVEMGAIRTADGGLAKDRRLWDAESLALSGDEALVGFERRHEVHRFAFDRDGFAARAVEVPTPPAMQDWPDNNGPEALAVLPATHPTHPGRPIVIGERPFGRDGASEAFVLGDGGFSLEVVRRDSFDITDADFLPSGDMILLERWFHPLRGVAMRLRRVRLADIRAGARLDGEIVLEAHGRDFHVDNMEALAIHRGPDGATVLTLVSDDNFSAMQRTLFLQFRWKGE